MSVDNRGVATPDNMPAGVPQNNAAAVRSCPHGGGRTGKAFFIEDEDEWGLQPLLQVSDLLVETAVTTLQLTGAINGNYSCIERMNCHMQIVSTLVCEAMA